MKGKKYERQNYELSTDSKIDIMTAIAEDKRAQQMLLEKDEMESSVGEIITE